MIISIYSILFLDLWTHQTNCMIIVYQQLVRNNSVEQTGAAGKFKCKCGAAISSHSHIIYFKKSIRFRSVFKSGWWGSHTQCLQPQRASNPGSLPHSKRDVLATVWTWTFHHQRFVEFKHSRLELSNFVQFCSNWIQIFSLFVFILITIQCFVFHNETFFSHYWFVR